MPFLRCRGTAGIGAVSSLRQPLRHGRHAIWGATLLDRRGGSPSPREMETRRAFGNQRRNTDWRIEDADRFVSPATPGALRNLCVLQKASCRISERNSLLLDGSGPLFLPVIVPCALGSTGLHPWGGSVSPSRRKRIPRSPLVRATSSWTCVPHQGRSSIRISPSGCRGVTVHLHFDRTTSESQSSCILGRMHVPAGNVETSNPSEPRIPSKTDGWAEAIRSRKIGSRNDGDETDNDDSMVKIGFMGSSFPSLITHIYTLSGNCQGSTGSMNDRTVKEIPEARRKS